MDWFKTSAAFWSHPKVAGLRDRAHRVMTSSWGYAAQHNTKGHISPTALKVVGGRPQDAQELVDAGLWHLNGDGWVIHDWEEHQAAAVAIERKRQADKDRLKRQRQENRGDADV